MYYYSNLKKKIKISKFHNGLITFWSPKSVWWFPQLGFPSKTLLESNVHLFIGFTNKFFKGTC